MRSITIRGARTHNLQNIDLDLPRERLICITGLSGSGKSSLAFDTIYAEGQRRYVESLSAYARQFLSMMDKPDVDHIEGLSPAIAIEQKTTSHNPRSTVGTVTEVYDYLRLLYARAGVPHCPVHDQPLDARTISEMVDQVLALPAHSRLMVLAPMVRDRKGAHRELLRALRHEGLVRVRIDGVVKDLDEVDDLDPKSRHRIEAVVDRFRVRPDLRQRLAESLETALRLGEGTVLVAPMDGDEPPLLFSERFACPECGFSLPALEPKLFSFNNPAGACPDCGGLGQEQFFDPERVVIHPELSLAGGAVRGWDRRNASYYAMICSLADAYGFDPETPYASLPETVREVILYGSGTREIEFRYPGDSGNNRIRRHRFEGVIPNLQRRYRETESSLVREELARYIGHRRCSACQGARLNAAACNVRVGSYRLPELVEQPVAALRAQIAELDLVGWRAKVAEPILREIGERLGFLDNVGLGYLTLARSADSLSGGESQRIRLASQIGAGLAGVMYVLDEPSIGLHQRDNRRLLDTLGGLRDLGNTVIVVEHDRDAIEAADYVVDMGPGAGVHGGRVVAEGTPEEIRANPASLTGQYLSGRRRIELPDRRRAIDPERVLRLCGARGNNLRRVDLTLPLGVLVCVTGVSGSGKSTLINETLYKHLAREINGAAAKPAPFDSFVGLEALGGVVAVDQSPIGRTPRSNPATYTGLFSPIRELFAATAEARSRGYRPGRFSFNVKGGRCEACQGEGLIKVEMHFLPDVYVHCDVCGGRRYNRETLEIRYKGYNIHEVLELTVDDALALYQPVPAVCRKLQTLKDVGLGYLRLGQSATTLSGGEAQRVKLAKELSRRDSGRTLYILDEPTTGLHFHDIEQLLAVLGRLVDRGNTVLVIEHNLDVIKTADWVVDLGPEGGEGGGCIIGEGPPESIARQPDSHTGRYLRPLLHAQTGHRIHHRGETTG